MAKPPVSIVIPAYNDAATLAACVHRVLTQTDYPDWEVIVVDDASTDGAPRRFGPNDRLRVIRRNTRGGVASALNTGIRAAAGRDIVRLHADVVVEDPAWLQQLVEAAEAKPKAAVIGARLVFPNGSIQSEGRELLTGFGITAPHGDRKAYQAAGTPGPTVEVDAVSGALAYYRRGPLDAIGGLDENYGPAWGEDDDYCIAVRRLGHKVYVNPRVSGVHYTRSCPPYMRTVVPDAKSPVLQLTYGIKEKVRRIQGNYWEAKWGWHPFRPDLSEIRRLYGDTEICWRIGERMRFRPAAEFPSVDCCLVTWNSLALLRRTLASVAATDYPADKLHLYIADNGSTDGTVPFLENLADYPFPIHLIKLPVNTGVTAGLNCALAAGKGELVARLDDDIELPANWLGILLADLKQRPFAGCVGGKTVNDDERAAIQWGCHYVHPTFYNCKDEPNRGQTDQLARVFHVSGCCNLYRRSVLGDAGLLDVRYAPTQYDDLDHHIALFHAGYEVLHDGRLSIVHKRTTSLDQSMPGITSVNANRAKMLGKWGKDCLETIETAILFSREGRTLRLDGDTSELEAEAPAPGAFPRTIGRPTTALTAIFTLDEELLRGDSTLENAATEYLAAAETTANLSIATETAAVALNVVPTSRDAFLGLTMILHRGGHAERARGVATRALHLYPEDPELSRIASMTWTEFVSTYGERNVTRADVGPVALTPVVHASVPAPRLRVLFVQPFQPRIFAEGAEQLRELVRHLRDRGIAANICDTAFPNPAGYDVAHFWGTASPFQTLAQMKAARAHAPGVPRVLTPWYVDRSALSWDEQVASSIFTNPGSGAQLEQNLQQLVAGQLTNKGTPRPSGPRAPFALEGAELCLRKVLELADHVLSVSQQERADLSAVTGVDVPWTIVSPGADPRPLADATGARFAEKFGVKDFLLAAGPVVARRNLVMLMIAARALNRPIVVLGPVVDTIYAKLCRCYATPATLFVPHVSPEQYVSALKAARAYVSTTWADATDPHAIAAGLAGTPLVLSTRLRDQQLFGSDPTFCDPCNFKAIRIGIEQAVKTGSSSPAVARVQQRLAQTCGWDEVVDRTLAAYAEAIESRSRTSTARAA